MSSWPFNEYSGQRNPTASSVHYRRPDEERYHEHEYQKTLYDDEDEDEDVARRIGAEEKHIPPSERPRKPAVKVRRVPFSDPFSGAWIDSDDEDFGLGDLFWNGFPRWWYDEHGPMWESRKDPARPAPVAAKQKQTVETIAKPRAKEPSAPKPAISPPVQPSLQTPPTPFADTEKIPVDFALPSEIPTADLIFSSLDSLGINHKDVGGAGDCLFLSLSDQIANSHSAGFPRLSARQIRAIVVDEINTNRELYKWDVLALACSGNAAKAESDSEAGYEAYVELMARPGTYGDAVCLAAFARVFDCAVNVWMWDSKRARVSRVVVEWEDEQTEMGNDEVMMWRRKLNVGWYPAGEGEAGNHYFSVYPPDGIEV